MLEEQEQYVVEELKHGWGLVFWSNEKSNWKLMMFSVRAQSESRIADEPFVGHAAAADAAVAALVRHPFSGARKQSQHQHQHYYSYSA